MQRTEIMLFCDKPDCERGPGEVGFSRRDNLTDHMKRKHGRVLLLARTAVNDSMSSATQIQNGNLEVASAVILPESQKQVALQSPETFDTSRTHASKRPRTDLYESSSAMGKSQRDEELSREVEQLRQELEKV